MKIATSLWLLVVGFAPVFACGESNDAGASSGGAGGATSGGTSGGESSGGTTSSSGTNGGTSDGGPIPEDDGLIPTTSIWRTTTEWYRPIDTAPVAEHSGEMIGALKTFGKADVFQIDFGFNVLDGTGAPTVSFPPNDEADSDPVPVPGQGYIEGDHAYDACPDGDDCHLIILDRGASRLYEVFGAHKNDSGWDGSLALWKLDKVYPRSNRGQGCTSADAAGLPIAPGLIGYKETRKGAINHALRFIIMNDYIRGKLDDRNTPNVVYPASHGSNKAQSAVGIPYGGRLRLKSSIQETDSRIKTPGARAVVRALQKYGAILADGGNLPLVAESVRVYSDANAAETWKGLLGPHDLTFLRPSDFEVIAIPKDAPLGTPGWYQTKADYEAQLKKPLGCDGIVQPQ